MKPIFVIGLMSGTSMDGINVTLVETNGIFLKRFGYNYIYDYSPKTKTLLKEVIEDKPKSFTNNCKIVELDELVTLDHFKAVTKFINKFNKHPDIVGFHGQTIYHNPKESVSIQLGNPRELSNKLKINVVGNFRENDLKSGGQGAPLAPVYHRYLMKYLNLALPSCFLNIGGVANLTYWDGHNLIGFDTGPGNGLMDLYMQNNLCKDYDKNGSLAKKGVPNENIVNGALRNNYFIQKYPKSLDKNEFSYFVENLNQKRLKHEDAMSTLINITVKSIKLSLNKLPAKTKLVYVMGGGANNKFLMELLNEKLEQTFININETKLPEDMIEAELIAFLSARTVYNYPSTFPETTGTSVPTITGKIYYK